MIRLIRAELSRLKSRRITWVAVILLVLAVGLLQFATYQSVQPPSAAEQAQGRVFYEQAKQEYEQNKAENEAAQKECLDAGNPAENCPGPPKLEQFVSLAPEFADLAEASVLFGVFLTGLALLFVGASFIGAEYSSGALANWLSFIPERGKVFASKLLALVAVAAVVNAVTTALSLGLTVLMFRLADLGVTGLPKVLQEGGRGIVIAVICAVLGFCIALVTRHTAAAVGVLLAYLVVSYIVSGLSFTVPRLQTIKPYLPENNVFAFIGHGYSYTDQIEKATAEGSTFESVQRTISFAHSAGYWAVIMVAVVGVSFWVFRRRDVN